MPKMTLNDWFRWKIERTTRLWRHGPTSPLWSPAMTILRNSTSHQRIFSLNSTAFHWDISHRWSTSSTRSTIFLFLRDTFFPGILMWNNMLASRAYQYFSYRTMRLMEWGFVSKWTADMFASNTKVQVDSNFRIRFLDVQEDTKRAIKITDLQGSFYLLVIGIALGILCFLAELIWKKIRK